MQAIDERDREQKRKRGSLNRQQYLLPDTDEDVVKMKTKTSFNVFATKELTRYCYGGRHCKADDR